MNISHAQIVEKLGGITAVAERLGIKPPSVSGWIEKDENGTPRNGIPEGRIIELGAEIERVCEYRRWHLRPNDWHVIWPELIGSKGAPRLPAGDIVNKRAGPGQQLAPVARRQTLHLRREGPTSSGERR